MAGAREGSRIRNMKFMGEGGAGKVDGEGRRSGERRTLCGIRCFQYDGTETGINQVGG